MHKKKCQQTLTSLSICRSIPRDFSMSLLFLCFLSSLLMVFSCLTSLCLLLCLSRARIWAFGGLNTPLLLPIIFGWSFAVGTYWPMKKIPKINFQVQVKFRLLLDLYIIIHYSVLNFTELMVILVTSGVQSFNLRYCTCCSGDFNLHLTILSNTK